MKFYITSYSATKSNQEFLNKGWKKRIA